jgi:hypothetical protein
VCGDAHEGVRKQSRISKYEVHNVGKRSVLRNGASDLELVVRQRGISAEGGQIPLFARSGWIILQTA